jgi:AcrR family transcriptional regulator
MPYVNYMVRSAAAPAARRRRSREEMKQSTREALVAAGLELFAEKGLDGPSLDEICARAGKTRGAFYVHFEDRDAFLTAVMARAGEATLDHYLGPRDAPLELHEIVRRFVGAVQEGRYLLGPGGDVKPHQLMDACARSTPVRDRYAAIVADTLARLTRAVAAAQSRKQVRTDVPASDAAAMLFAAVLGVQTMLELDLPIDLPRAAGAAITLFTR